MAATEQQYCLKWNNHRPTLFSVFDTLLEEESLVDVTLSAEGQFLRAHRIILSACSPYFRVRKWVSLEHCFYKMVNRVLTECFHYKIFKTD